MLFNGIVYTFSDFQPKWFFWIRQGITVVSNQFVAQCIKCQKIVETQTDQESNHFGILGIYWIWQMSTRPQKYLLWFMFWVTEKHTETNCICNRHCTNKAELNWKLILNTTDLKYQILPKLKNHSFFFKAFLANNISTTLFGHSLGIIKTFSS